MLSIEAIEHQAQTYLGSVEGRYSFDQWADSKDFFPIDRRKIASAIKMLKIARSKQAEEKSFGESI